MQRTREVDECKAQLSRIGSMRVLCCGCMCVRTRTRPVVLLPAEAELSKQALEAKRSQAAASASQEQCDLLNREAQARTSALAAVQAELESTASRLKHADTRCAELLHQSDLDRAASADVCNGLRARLVEMSSALDVSQRGIANHACLLACR